MDWHLLLRLHWAHVVNRLTQHIQHAAQRLLANWNSDRRAQIERLHAANETVGRFHCDGADAAFTDVLRHFGSDVDFYWNIEAFAGDANSVKDLRDMSFRKLNFNCWTCDLDYVSFGV